MICQRIPTSLYAIALCFNKSIADEFQAKLPQHVQACTLHSLGFAAVRRAVPHVILDDDKLRKILDFMPALNAIDEAERRVIKADLETMVGLVTDMHLNPTSQEEIEGAIEQTRRGVEALPKSFPFLADVMNAMDSWTNCVTFGEMLRHPLIHGYSFWQYHAVLVDEAQDLNAVQHALLARIVAPGGKLIAVGDRAQSIYGFRGADPKSMDRLKTEWNMIELPLDVSFRCPREVVKEAQKFVGDSIKPADGAEEGKIERRPVVMMARTESELAAGHMVLCRVNAPLVPLAFRLIRRGIYITLRGRDLGEGLLSLIKKLRGVSPADLIEKVRRWADKQIDILRAANKPASVIEGVQDKVETLICFAEECNTVSEIVTKVETLFSDQPPGGTVLLSTVHKAKGLEADTVVILRPDLLPAPWAKTDNEKEQEKNIAYVAVTRAKKLLIFQESPKDKPKKKVGMPIGIDDLFSQVIKEQHERNEGR